MLKRKAGLMTFAIGSLLAVLLLAQPRGAYAGPGSPSLPSPQAVTIEFGGPLGFAYSPDEVFVLPGTQVKWQGDFSMHPLVSDEGLWQTVSAGTEFTFTFSQPGVYHYHCFFHGSLGMTGTVTVGYRALLPLIER